MNNTNYLSLIFLIISVSAFAQDPVAVDTTKNWDLGGTGTITLTQASQKNWVKGGEAALSFLGTLELKANYKKDKHNWENLGIFSYGQQKNGSQKDFRISDDRIDIASKYGYQAGKNLFYSALVGLKSQFADGYNYPEDAEKFKVSEFLSPGYVSASLGMDYKPIEGLSVFLSPASLKSTYVLDTVDVDGTFFGLEPGATSRHEVGAFFKAKHTITVWKIIGLENNLELFTNYLQNPENVDVNWDFKLIISANKYLKTIFSSTLIYDDDVSIPDPTPEDPLKTTAAIQFKQMLSVGLLLDF
jgi:hypothetical protein